MSRKITIATKLNDPEAVKLALDELNCNFEQTKDNYFKVKAGSLDYMVEEAEVRRFRYTGVQIDTANEEASFDEDCEAAKAFVEGPLKQAYAKNLFLKNANLDGDILGDITVISDSIPTVDGFGGVLENGDIVIESTKPYYG